MARHGSIAPEHEDVIANDLVVVLCEVARIAAFVVTIWHLAIGLHGKMATKTSGYPRRMAGETRHVFIAMGKGLGVRFRPTVAGLPAWPGVTGAAGPEVRRVARWRLEP